MVKSTEKKTNRAFKALADPTRRGILRRLAKEEATAGRLAEPYAMSAPAISKHLKVLEEAQLISRLRRGKEHVFRFEPKAMDPAMEVIRELTGFWNQRLDYLDTYLKSKGEHK